MTASPSPRASSRAPTGPGPRPGAGELVFGEEVETTVTDLAGQRRPEETRTDLAGGVLRRLLCGLPSAGQHTPLGRFYLDCTNALELALPEVTTPPALVLTREALHLRLQAVVPPGTLLTYANLSHGAGFPVATRGHHLNYRVPAAVTPDRLARELTSLLVTQSLFGGAGSVVPGYGFVLSGRAIGIAKAFHPGGDVHRADCKAIVNGVRDAEPLSGPGFVRHMITCLDTVRSHRGIALASGVPALALALLAQGSAWPGPHLADPLASLQAGNHDLSFTLRHPCQDGSSRTLLELEAAGLAWVEAHRERLPDWAALVTELWRERHLRMAAGQWRGMDTLHDAPMKFTLLSEQLAEAGLGWATLGIRYAELALSRRSPQGRVSPPSRGRAFDAVARLLLADHHFSAPGGLFDQLDRSGCLDHRLVTQGAARELLARGPRPEDGFAPRAVRRARAFEAGGVLEADWGWLRYADREVKLPDPLDE